MICPTCGSFTPDGSRFCCCCFSRISIEETQDNAPTEAVIEGTQTSIPSSLKKKGRLWPPMLILGILFAIGLTLFVLIGNTSAADPDIPWFTVQNGKLYFNETLYTGGNELTVPAAIGGQTVTIISDDCFSGCLDLTTVYLPEGIEYIGDRAFAGCLSLRGMKLPETLSTLGSEAFSGCRNLEAICIPYSVIQVGKAAFHNCSALSYIFYPGPVAAWENLDVDSIDEKTKIYCVDGIRQGK